MIPWGLDLTLPLTNIGGILDNASLPSGSQSPQPNSEGVSLDGPRGPFKCWASNQLSMGGHEGDRELFHPQAYKKSTLKAKCGLMQESDLPLMWGVCTEELGIRGQRIWGGIEQGGLRGGNVLCLRAIAEECN